MAVDTKKAATKYPFQVWVVDGNIAAGFDTQEEADRDAETRNKEAVELGIEARYHVIGHVIA